MPYLSSLAAEYHGDKKSGHTTPKASLAAFAQQAGNAGDGPVFSINSPVRRIEH
jgi:hypothetical protein